MICKLVVNMTPGAAARLDDNRPICCDTPLHVVPIICTLSHPLCICKCKFITNSREDYVTITAFRRSRPPSPSHLDISVTSSGLNAISRGVSSAILSATSSHSPAKRNIQTVQPDNSISQLKNLSPASISHHQDNAPPR